MKKYLFFGFFSALLGGLVVLIGMKEMGFDKQVFFAPAPSVEAKLTKYSDDGTVAFPDFKVASKEALPAVVHIESMVKMKNNQRGGYGGQQLPEIFRDFFGDQFQQPQRQGRPQQEFQRGSGSGVIISADGYIVTNNHVVANADKLEVTLTDKRTYTAEVIGLDPSTDLALIKIDGKDLPVIALANSDDVEVGEWVLAVGNPFNLEGTVTAGIVSAKGRSINILEDKAPIESFIQTDAAINPGNSGGALVNQNGALVGINSAIASPTGSYTGYGFAIPSNLVAKVVADLREHGVVQRGFLGAMIRQVDGNLAKEKGLAVNEGVYVDKLTEDGAAAKAGLEEGDVIRQINGTATETSNELLEIIGRHRPGDKLEVTVLRAGKTLDIPVVLKNSMGNTEVVTKKSQISILEALGADFSTLDVQSAQKLNIRGGVVVNNLRRGKLTRQTDMRDGFIITKADGKPVRSVEELVKILQDREGGVMIEGIYPDMPGIQYYAFGL